MSYFVWGSIILIIATLIYWAVFAVLIYYWHEKKTTVAIVPALFTFDFLIIGFFVMCIIVIMLQYGPEVIKTLTV